MLSHFISASINNSCWNKQLNKSHICIDSINHRISSTKIKAFTRAIIRWWWSIRRKVPGGECIITVISTKKSTWWWSPSFSFSLSHIADKRRCRDDDEIHKIECGDTRRWGQAVKVYIFNLLLTLFFATTRAINISICAIQIVIIVFDTSID